MPPHDGWTVLGVDLAAAAQWAGASFSEVRRLQLCAHMRVRGAYTSDLVYSPKASSSCHPHDSQLCVHMRVRGAYTLDLVYSPMVSSCCYQYDLLWGSSSFSLRTSTQQPTPKTKNRPETDV